MVFTKMRPAITNKMMRATSGVKHVEVEDSEEEAKMAEVEEIMIKDEVSIPMLGDEVA